MIAKYNLIVAFFAMSLAGSYASAAPIIIDDFNVPPSAVHNATVGLDSFPVTFTNTGIATANTIGGVREGSANFVGVPTNGDSIGINYGALFGGTLTMGTVGTQPTTLSLTYDGVAGAGLGLNANLASQAGIAIQFNILDAAAIGTAINLALTDGDGDIFSAAVTVGALGPQTVSFSFMAFTDTNVAGNGVLNLGDIDRINLLANIPANGDFRINDISAFETVPEPSTFAMAGMFVALLGGGLLLLRRSIRSAVTVI